MAAGLTDEERRIYEWQMWLPGFGAAGQEKLKGASVLISRLGGVGGTIAYYLAAAGVGRLILAHAGEVKESDLNRQILMTDDWIGRPRIESAQRRLRELNPRVEIVAVAENIGPANVERLVSQADIAIGAAPLFEERIRMNDEAVRQGKPLVDCAMFGLEVQVTTVIPRQTPCLRCLYPVVPEHWRREFPVVGAVSGAIACLGALEVIKLLTGIGSTLRSTLLVGDLGEASFRKLAISRREDCAVCGAAPPAPASA